METLDTSDRKILNALQRDCTLSLDQLAELAALSRNAVWRRIKAMEARGIIRARVALLDPSGADPDLVGELLREKLNVVHPDEVVLTIDRADAD